MLELSCFDLPRSPGPAASARLGADGPGALPVAVQPAGSHFFRCVSGGGTMFHTVVEVPAGWQLRLRRISGTLRHLGGPRQLLLGVNGRAGSSGSAGSTGQGPPRIVERQLLCFSEPDGPEQYLLPLTPLDLPVRPGERLFVSVQGAQNALSVFIAGEWEAAPASRCAGGDR